MPSRDRFRIHDLRHTAGSMMIQAGYPPKMLQEILGHASITTTLDLYGHLYPGEMDRYAERLDSAAGDADKAKIRPDDDEDEQATHDYCACLGKHERARRDSNPQPSDP